MLPMRFFRSRAFSASNVVGFLMFFGVFGSIFLTRSSSRPPRATRR